MIWTAFQWWCNVMGALHNVTGYQKMCPGVTSLTPREKLLKMQEALHSLEAITGKLSLDFSNWAGFVTTQPQWGLKCFVMKLCLHWLLQAHRSPSISYNSWHMGTEKKGTKFTSDRCCAPCFGGWRQTALTKPESSTRVSHSINQACLGQGHSSLTVCPDTGRADLRAGWAQGAAKPPAKSSLDRL